MPDRLLRSGSIPVRRALAGSGLRWALPLLVIEAVVVAALVFAAGLELLPAVAALAVLFVATAAVFRLLARNMEAMGLWVLGQDEERVDEPPVLDHWIGGDAVEGIMNGVYGALQERDNRIDQLAAETGRMLDTLPDPLFMVSRAGRVVRLNRAGRLLFGEDTMGQDVARLVRNPALEEAVDRALAGEPAEVIEIAVTSGQVERVFTVEVAPMPVTGNGGPAVMAMFHDITEIRRTEQMRVDFVANASHEIRSPLATLIGCIETLQGPAREDIEAQGRFLEMMDDQGRRMARLVEDLLSLSRIELKEHAQPTGTVDIGLMLARLRTSLQFQAEERGMVIELELDNALRPVRGDDGEVEQAIYNLLSNAIKYGWKNTPVSLRAGLAETAPPHLRLTRGPLVWVAVGNQGDPIGPQHIPRLTERFYRIDTARSREMGGTGLGLAIVKHVLNRHRGELHVTSRAGEGSVFTIWLPAVAQP